ncbi:DNA-binding CsgD family transcriptional regulator [Arthrobacter pascens]|nr:DNA-binding CsgD family transcriptional regulator [Arthrobacter pascens]
MLVQWVGSGIPIAVPARDYGISRETFYQYLRHAKQE